MDFRKYAIVETHLHLDGALSSKVIIKVAKKEGTTLPSYDPKILDTYLMVPKDCDSLNEYLKRFEIPNLVLQSEYGLRECTLDLLKRLRLDGVRYAEIRMAPQLSTTKGLSQDEVVSILLATIKEGESLYNIKANLILCMMRGNNHKANIETVEVANKYKNKGVVALDLAGAEALFPNEQFKEEFALANKYELNITIHAGEALGYESVVSAIEFGAKRIGHGTHSEQSEELMDYLAKHHIPLEMCPTSNVDTKAIKEIKDMPIRKYLDRGILVTLSTDDPTVSNITLKEEYENLYKCGYSLEDLKKIASNSVNSIFASDDVKTYLLNLLD